jgi:hypothetical protein
MMTARTLTAYSATSISISGLTRGPERGWKFDGQALAHPMGLRLQLSLDASERVRKAIAASDPGSYEEMTGHQLSQLPEADRTGYEYIAVRNEVHGMYAKQVQPTPGTCELTQADIVEIIRVR